MYTEFNREVKDFKFTYKRNYEDSSCEIDVKVHSGCAIMSSRVQFVPIRLHSVLNAFKLLMSKLIRRRYLLPEV